MFYKNGKHFVIFRDAIVRCTHEGCDFQFIAPASIAACEDTYFQREMPDSLNHTKQTNHKEFDVSFA